MDNSDLTKFPFLHRTEEYFFFDSLFKFAKICFPFVWVHGNAGTAKTSTIKACIAQNASNKKLCVSFVNMKFFIDERSFFADVLHEIVKGVTVAANEESSCKSFASARFDVFYKNIKNLLCASAKSLYIVLDNWDDFASCSMTFAANFLQKLLATVNCSLQEGRENSFCIGVIVVGRQTLSSIPAVFCGNYNPAPFVVHFNQYSKEEISEILKSLQNSSFFSRTKETISSKALNTKSFGLFIDLMLDYLYPVYQNFNELLVLVQRALAYFYQSEISQREFSSNENRQANEADAVDVSAKAIFTAVQPHIPLLLASLAGGCHAQNSDAAVQNLPVLARFLLIASFLASHNPEKFNGRIFSTAAVAGASGKKAPAERQPTTNTRKRLSTAQAFCLKRVFAICRNIISQDARLSNTLIDEGSLLTLINRLVSLNLIRCVNADGFAISLKAHAQSLKFKCNVGIEVLKAIAKSCKVDIKNYLFAQEQ